MGVDASDYERPNKSSPPPVVNPNAMAMTMRDVVAAQVLAQLAASGAQVQEAKRWAQDAYCWADALLCARAGR